jgi:ABC-2 type transport system permease protein
MALHDAVVPMGAAMLLIALQHWISLRFSSFAASVGVGITGTIIGYITVNSVQYGPWWPWGLGIQLLANRAGAAEHALWYSAIGAVVVTIAGTIEFSRREMR